MLGKWIGIRDHAQSTWDKWDGMNELMIDNVICSIGVKCRIVSCPSETESIWIPFSYSWWESVIAVLFSTIDMSCAMSRKGVRYSSLLWFVAKVRLVMTGRPWQKRDHKTARIVLKEWGKIGLILFNWVGFAVLNLSVTICFSTYGKLSCYRFRYD